MTSIHLHRSATSAGQPAYPVLDRRSAVPDTEKAIVIAHLQRVLSTGDLIEGYHFSTGTPEDTRHWFIDEIDRNTGSITVKPEDDDLSDLDGISFNTFHSTVDLTIAVLIVCLLASAIWLRFK